MIGLLREYGIDGGIVCELGCGTGSITRRLRDAGYDMIGIDISEDMLDVAREYEFEKVWQGEDGCTDILYLNQDMREFEHGRRHNQSLRQYELHYAGGGFKKSF